MDESLREELIGVANEWDQAMVENDVEAIGRYMADDWTIIGSDGSVGDKPGAFTATPPWSRPGECLAGSIKGSRSAR